MAKFIFQRAHKLRGARSLLPYFVRDMVTEIMKAGYDNSNNSDDNDNNRRIHIQTLSELLVKSFSDTYACITTNTKKSRSQKAKDIDIANEPNRVAAAAAMCNVLALDEFSKQDRSLLWKRSTAFGRPLSAAAYCGQLLVVKGLVKQGMRDYGSEYNLSRTFTPNSFTEAMCHAIEKEHHQIAKYLLNRYGKIFGAVREDCLEKLLPATIKAGNLELLRLLLSARTHAGVRTIYYAFKLSCQADLPQLSRVFFEHGALKVDELVGAFYPSACYPLETAINQDAILVVQELLHLGASPDGPRYVPNHRRPFPSALESRKASICCLLLEGGANPHHVSVTTTMLPQLTTLLRDHRDLRRALALALTYHRSL